MCVWSVIFLHFSLFHLLICSILSSGLVVGSRRRRLRQCNRYTHTHTRTLSAAAKSGGGGDGGNLHTSTTRAAAAAVCLLAAEEADDDADDNGVGEGRLQK